MRPAGLWALMLVCGCGGGANFTLFIEFPDQEVRTRVNEVEIWALRAEEGKSCNDLVFGRARPADLEELAHVLVSFPPAQRADLKGVEGGQAFFLAEGRGGGVALLRGCSAAMVETGKSQEITISLLCICNPQNAHCAPIDEIPTDGRDNDCDGKTDEECEGTSDCDDGVSCTRDGCLVAEGRCTHVADDALCPDDGLFCNGGEFCDPARDCTGRGDPCFSAGLVCDEDTDGCVSCTEDDQCADVHECTHDACDEGLCTHQADDQLCPDDGVFCNGGEFCDAQAGCQHRGNPCQGQETCDEQSRSCLTCPDCHPVWFFLPTSGGGRVSLTGYRVDLFLAPAGPAGVTWSGNYKVSLGPAAVAKNR